VIAVGLLFQFVVLPGVLDDLQQDDAAAR
jgi:hypothetical protein